MRLFRFALSISQAGLCAACCTFNCGVPDLEFVSLESPTSSEVQTQSARPDIFRATFKPGELKLRVSTTQDLFKLQERNNTYGTDIVVKQCGDASGTFVSIGQVYTNDGWIVNAIVYLNDYRKNGVRMKDYSIPPQPAPQSIDGSRYVYEAPVSLDNMLVPFKAESGGQSLRFVPLPRDPRQLPDLCFRLGSGGFLTSFSSREVRLPRDAINDLLLRSALPQP